jgi:hypothetical protein
MVRRDATMDTTACTPPTERKRDSAAHPLPVRVMTTRLKPGKRSDNATTRLEVRLGNGSDDDTWMLKELMMASRDPVSE